MIIAFLLLMAVSPSDVKAQGQKSKSKFQKEKNEDDKIVRWDFGINFGATFANGYTANFYNGSQGNLNTISYIMTNKYWYQEIKLLLQASDTVILREMPTNMHYNTALSGGLYFRYNFTPRWSLFFEANYARLKTDGIFTVQVDPASYLTTPDIRLFGVHGTEQRVNFDIGGHCKFPVYRKKMNLFLDAGLNVNYVRVLKNFINFNEKEYSIINIYGNQYYVPNTNLQEYQNIEGGLGYGLYAGGGTGFTFTPQLGLELGGYVDYISVDLEGYKQFKPSAGIYIRFLLSNIINGDD
ncbi:MAG: hypothetical protein Q8867_08795 [Bacteroidota bacterium]|nr:hypothetical protein [Bacteroidota bacterium]